MKNSIEVLLRLDTIQNRVKLLMNQLEEAKIKLKNTEIENEQLKTSLKLQEQNLKNLQKNQENEQKDFRKRDFFAKLVQNTGGLSGDTSELKKALDDYIKEIESCIAKLSN
ncbi:MAG: hypothetical protein V4683_13550 [Bacteroidota bacterium]